MVGNAHVMNATYKRYLMLRNQIGYPFQENMPLRDWAEITNARRYSILSDLERLAANRGDVPISKVTPW